MSSRPSSYPLMSPGSMRMFSTEEMVNMPPPGWLIEGIIPAGGLVGLYGPPGIKKSFLAVDIALTVAAGIPWHGRKVEPGFPLYIGAEGGTGIGKRLKAWLKYRKLRPADADAAWLTEAVPVYTDSDGLRAVLDRIEHELPRDRVPHLVVIDTLARCFDGDENQQEDMGRFVAGVDTLRKDLGATVIIVHHTRLDGDRERGNTAFRGAADTMMSLGQGKGGLLTLTCNKQKDAEEFDPISFRIREVPEADSIVLLGQGGGQGTKESSRGREDLMLAAVRVHSTGISWDAWQAAVSDEIPRSTFGRLVARLREKGEIIKENGLFVIPE